jgi:hypothetical protein
MTAARRSRSIPLVRVEGNPKSGYEVTPESLVKQPRLFPNFKTPRSCTAEKVLGLNKDSLYFYVGYACPEFGDMVFVYDSAMSATWRGTATPFDTGGIIGYIHATGLPGRSLTDAQRKDAAPLTEAEKAPLREYVQDHLIANLAEWQDRFEEFITEFFDGPANYVRRDRPKIDDKTGRHLDVRNEPRAWTWEIQAHREHHLFEGLRLMRMTTEKQRRLKLALHDAPDHPWWEILDDERIFDQYSDCMTAEETCAQVQAEILSWL